MLAAIAAVRSALAGLSNSEAKEVLTIASAPYGQRLASVHAAASAAQVQPNSRSPSDPKGAGGKPNRVSWKKDPRFVAWTQQRQNLVAAVKSDSSQVNLDALHAHEADLKSLKKEILGFRQD